MDVTHQTKYIPILLVLTLAISTALAQSIDYRSQIKNKPMINDQDSKYANNISLACTDAVTFNIPLNITKTWDLNATCAANIQFNTGGKFQPTSGHTATFTGTLDGDLSQHFDLSAGGAFNLSGAIFKQLYPQWFGAKCNGADDTVAIQNTFNTVSHNQIVQFVCTSTVIPPVWLPSSAQGAIVRNAAYPQWTSNTADTLIAKSGSASAPLLISNAASVKLENLYLDCNNGTATSGLVFASALLDEADNVQTMNCSGDGIQINPLGGGYTNITNTITASTVNPTVNIPAININGLLLGSHLATYAGVVLDAGTLSQDKFTITSISGTGPYTLVLNGTSTHQHNAGATFTVDGSGNLIKLSHPHTYSSGYSGCIPGNGTAGTAPGVGWGINIYTDPDNDINAISITAPVTSGNACGGAVLAGFRGYLDPRGGQFNSDTGPAIQIGDLAFNGSTGLGREGIFWTIEPFADLEESSSAYDVVNDICGQNNMVRYLQQSEFVPAASGSACTFLSLGVGDLGIGLNIGSTEGDFSSYATTGRTVNFPGIGFQFFNYAGSNLGEFTLNGASNGGFIVSTPNVSGSDAISSSGSKSLCLTSNNGCGIFSIKLGHNGGIALGANVDCGAFGSGAAVCIATHTPSSGTETFPQGTFTFDANNFYGWTATNVVKQMPWLPYGTVGVSCSGSPTSSFVTVNGVVTHC